MNERCETCNGELSQCGQPGVDGEPSMDCLVCKLRVQNNQLYAENTILRGLLPKLGKPCMYCGLEDIGKCKRGFPGCAQADDIMAADDELCSIILKEDKELKAKIEALQKSNDYLNDVCGSRAVELELMKKELQSLRYKIHENWN